MFNDRQLFCSVILAGFIVALSDGQFFPGGFRQPSYQSMIAQRLAALLGRRAQGAQTGGVQGQGFQNNAFGLNNNNGFRGFGSLGGFGQGLNRGFSNLNGGFGGAANQASNGYKNFKAVSSTFNSVNSDSGFGNKAKLGQYGNIGKQGGFGSRANQGTYGNTGNQFYGRQAANRAGLTNQATARRQAGQFGSQGIGQQNSAANRAVGVQGGQRFVG